MTGILAEIVAYKREFVAESKRRLPQEELERRASDGPSPRDFIGALEGDGCSLIAEIKTASPSRGIIRDDVSVEDVARIYADNGASCISVLTDERYFRGSLDRIGRARRVSGLPILRKDFIIDPYQVYEARHAGADAVLLIAACLDNEMLTELIEVTALCGMQYLVEIHDSGEAARVNGLDAPLIGINNRDLRTFTTDLAVTGRLGAEVPDTALLVSESGIFTADDVREVHRMGAGAVLVGEAVIREADMAGKVRELAGAA